jgi:hypothetical protein
MFLSKIMRALSLIWILAGGLLAACRPDSEPPLLTPTAESLPTPAPISAPPASAVPVEGLILNEDPPRTSLFNINTLAYELPGMDTVEVLNYTYAYLEDRPLTMDVYYPPGTAADAELPVVVFGLGYRMSKEPLRNAHFYTSWGKLVAAAGMVGVTYDTEQPDQDLETVLAFIQDNAAALRVDATQIGLMSSSANVPTVMSYLMQERREDIQFGVYYYGLSLTPDHKYTEEFGQVCEPRGCLVKELADVTYVDPELPLFVVKAGKDFIPNINEAMDHFLDYVRAAGAPVTVIDYEEGVHGFDTQQGTDESAEIMAETIAFMKENFRSGRGAPDN